MKNPISRTDATTLRVSSSVDEPSTALMLIPKRAVSFNRSSFFLTCVHDFCDHSFGSMLSTDICSIDRPASFSRSIHWRVSA